MVARHLWHTSVLCFAACASVVHAQQNALDQPWLARWVETLASTSGVSYVTYAESGSASGVRLQMEDVLARYPDGYRRLTRVFEVKSGLNEAELRRRAEECVLAWDGAAGHALDIHVVPGAGRGLQRMGNLGPFMEIPGMQAFDAPRDGFAAFLVARKLKGDNPRVRVQDTPGRSLVEVAAWKAAFGFQRANEQAQAVLDEINVMRPDGSLGTRELLSEFKTVEGYAVGVPFKRELWVHEGEGSNADGSVVPAGLHLVQTTRLLTFALRNDIIDGEFEPQGSYKAQPLRVDTTQPSLEGNPSSQSQPVATTDVRQPGNSPVHPEPPSAGAGRSAWYLGIASLLVVGLVAWLKLRKS